MVAGMSCEECPLRSRVPGAPQHAGHWFRGGLPAELLVPCAQAATQVGTLFAVHALRRARGEEAMGGLVGV